MAIDKNRTKDLLTQIDALFSTELVAGLPIPQVLVNTVRDKVMGPALTELHRLVDEARPPVFYLLGRSGHGKSSLINALAGQEVAPVGTGADPCTVGITPYRIRFPQQYSEWVVYDSRGIFEVHRPTGAAADNAVEVVKNDILKHRPDIILHVLTTKEVRACAQDLQVLKEIQAALCKQQGAQTPILVVLTHPDGLGDVLEWPPEAHPDKQSVLADHVRVMTEHGAAAGRRYKLIGDLPLYRGCQIDQADCPFLYVIPLNVPEKAKNRWNLDTLIDIISGQLPAAARLEFFQALQRKEMLRRMAADLVSRFAFIATGIGATPIPFADLAILTPFQVLMISVIGGLSCRELSLKTAAEFTAASGVVVGGGFALREVFRQVVKFLGVPGDVIAGTVAGAGTYALGKSAEAYFFANEVHKPEEFARDYEASVNEEGTGLARHHRAVTAAEYNAPDRGPCPGCAFPREARSRPGLHPLGQSGFAAGNVEHPQTAPPGEASCTNT